MADTKYDAHRKEVQAVALFARACTHRSVCRRLGGTSFLNQLTTILEHAQRLHLTVVADVREDPTEPNDSERFDTVHMALATMRPRPNILIATRASYERLDPDVLAVHLRTIADLGMDLIMCD